MKRRLLLFGLLATLLIAGWVVWELMSPYQGYPERVVVEIRPRTGVKLIASRLRGEGVLAYRRPFLILYSVLRPWNGIKAGEYEFKGPLRPWDVYWKLVDGDVYYYPVIVPEGMDIFDVAKAVSRQLPIEEEAFLKVANDPSMIKDLDSEATSLEGYLFPDTYRVSHYSSPQSVARAMTDRFRRVLAGGVQKKLEASGMSLREALTLASLIEKETGRGGERPLIAGVFRNRLRRRVLLQCDPTVIYAARLNGRYKGKGVIRQSDLAFDSPYNTYRYPGLPPGPIANPGLKSIEAALEPADVKYLYFVSDNQGGHVFSRTLNEHLRAVRRYRRGRVVRASGQTSSSNSTGEGSGSSGNEKE